MRLSALLLIVIALLSPATAATLKLDSVTVAPVQVNRNLISNYSFEEIGDGGVPAGWSWSQGPTDAVCTVETKEKHSGSRSLYLENHTMYGPNILGCLTIKQPIQLQAGKTYTLSCWMKGASDGGNGVWIGSWENSFSLPIYRDHWKRVWKTFTPSAADAVFYPRIVTASITPGIYIDDLKLEEGDQPTPCMPADTLAHLEPLEYERTIEGDGEFALDLILVLPSEVPDGVVEAAINGVTAGVRRSGGLDAGAYTVTVKGQAVEADAAAREVLVRVLDGGRSVATAKVAARFPSLAGANRRLSALRAKLPKLKNMLNAVKAKGQDVTYPLITYTVLENFCEFAWDDINSKDLIRGLVQIGEMEPMARRLDRQLKVALTGKEQFFAVPRLVGGERPQISGPSFVAQVADAKGKIIAKRPVFLVGYGHFNEANRDVEKFPSYGVNIIQNYTLPNETLPSEGVVSDGPVNFQRNLLNRARRAGVMVDILLSPHCPPEWILRKYPQLRKQRSGFIKYCIHAPEGQDMLKQYIRATVAPIADHPALNSICLSNEPDNLEEPCEYATKEWRAWLERRHGTVGRLNERWGTSLKSFDEATLPNPFSAPSPYTPDRRSGRFYDYCRFNAEWFAGWHKMLADTVHEVAPNVPVHVKASDGCFMWPDSVHAGVDAYLFSQFSQINGNDSSNYYNRGEGEFAQSWLQNAMGYDLQRSVKDAPVFNSENHLIPDRDVDPLPTSQVRSVIWQDATHGQSATTIWTWQRDHNPRSDFAGSVMTRPSCAEAVGYVCSDLNRAAMEVTAVQKLKPQVAILHSHSSLVWDAGDYWNTEVALYTALAFTGLKIGFIAERQLEDGILPGARVILVPNARHISDAARETLMRYTGRIISVGGSDSLSLDDYNHPRPWGRSLGGPPFDPQTDSWRRLWRSVNSYLRDSGTKPLVQLTGLKGEPVWGVEWLSAKTPTGLVVNLCNYRKQPMTVKLIANGKPFRATDVLTGAKVVGAFTLRPLETRLVVGR